MPLLIRTPGVIWRLCKLSVVTASVLDLLLSRLIWADQSLWFVLCCALRRHLMGERGDNCLRVCASIKPRVVFSTQKTEIGALFLEWYSYLIGMCGC